MFGAERGVAVAALGTMLLYSILLLLLPVVVLLLLLFQSDDACSGPAAVLDPDAATGLCYDLVVAVPQYLVYTN